MDDKNALKDKELEIIAGGIDHQKITDLMKIKTYDEALKIADELGDGKDMGTWKTMSGDEFLEKWRSAHNL